MTVSMRHDDGVAYLAIDDGKVNAMSRPLLLERSAAMAEAQSANAIVLITGRPDIFSAGFDMKTFAAGPEASAAMVAAGIDVILAILEHPRPVITCATGHAFPMGAFLMLAADIRLGLAGDYVVGMNEPAIKIDVPEFALALAQSRLTAPAYAGIRTAQMFAPLAAVAAGYLDFISAAAGLDALIEAQLSVARALDPAAFESTKRRMNAPVAAAIRAAGVPKRLQQ